MRRIAGSVLFGCSILAAATASAGDTCGKTQQQPAPAGVRPIVVGKGSGTAITIDVAKGFDLTDVIVTECRDKDKIVGVSTISTSGRTVVDTGHLAYRVYVKAVNPVTCEYVEETPEFSCDQPTPTPVPTSTATPKPTSTPVPTATPVSTPVSTPVPTPTPEPTPVVTPTVAPTPVTPSGEPSCRMIPTTVKPTALISTAKRVFDTGVKYFKKAGSCGYRQSVKKISSAEKVFRSFERTVKQMPKTVEVCGDDCVDVVTTRTYRSLETWAKTLKNFAVDSQRQGRIACRNKGPGIADTAVLNRALDKAVKTCPTSVCP